MTNAHEFNPYNPREHIPAEPGPVFWFVMGGVAAFSLVLLYLAWRF